MFYYLMHKDIRVASMDIDESGGLSKVQVLNYEHLPVGAQMNTMKFVEWWHDRATPRTRHGAAQALKKLGFATTNSLLVNNLALSLTDCYWVKPVKSDACWHNINLYNNNFIDIFGDLTFDSTKKLSQQLKGTAFRYATSQGELQKKWIIDSAGLRVLVKGNYGNSYQQSLNEVYASTIHSLQKYDAYTPYFLTTVAVEGGTCGLGCYSYNFCNDSVEYVSAWELLQTVKLRQNESWFTKFKSICVNKLGFSEDYFHKFMDYEICTDFLLTNTDRHMNNIGVLRNADTLQYIGFAPIYDTGNAMFYKTVNLQQVNLLSIATCSFNKWEVDILRNVQNKNVVNLEMLPTKDMFMSVYLQDTPERVCRAEQLYDLFCKKAMYLNEFQNNVDLSKKRNAYKK